MVVLLGALGCFLGWFLVVCAVFPLQLVLMWLWFGGMWLVAVGFLLVFRYMWREDWPFVLVGGLTPALS